MEKVSKKEFKKATEYLKEHLQKHRNDRIAFFVDFDTYIDESAEYMYVTVDNGKECYKVYCSILVSLYKAVRYLFIHNVEANAKTMGETSFYLDPITLNYQQLTLLSTTIERIKTTHL